MSPGLEQKVATAVLMPDCTVQYSITGSPGGSREGRRDQQLGCFSVAILLRSSSHVNVQLRLYYPIVDIVAGLGEGREGDYHFVSSIRVRGNSESLLVTTYRPGWRELRPGPATTC